MIDLALKMMLDEKARFAATVLGVGFAAGLVLVQVGLFFGLLENASITIDRIGADLWITARNTPERRFRQPVSRAIRASGSIDTRCGAGRQLDRLVRDRHAALGAKESVIYYGLENFPAWSFPWDIESGDPGRSQARPLCHARPLGRAPVWPVPGWRLSRVSRPPSEDHRPHPRSSLVHDQSDGLSGLPAGAVTFARRAFGADDVHRWSGSSRAPTLRPSGARFAAGCLIMMFIPAASGPGGRAATGSTAPGSG